MTAPPNLPALPEGRFEGRQAFGDLIRGALQTAAQAGWRHMVWCDPDFADWPLGERAVIDSLNQWAGRGRTLQLLARDFDALRQQHPRLVQWRATWDHLVTARAWPGAAEGEIPSALWSPVWALECLDPARGRGVCGHDPARRTVLQERINQAWERATPAFAATTLGL